MTEETFGRYKLSRQMAVGGMAEIWLARQRGPGGFEKVLVLKRILPHLAVDEAFVHMFLDEARLAAQLSHPHIAAVTDFGEVEDVYYLAMELVRGPDLKKLLRSCVEQGLTIPPPVAARIVSQVCAALDYAHKARDGQGQPLNVIHRDVSPQNILVTLDGDAKLVDFGIARAMSQSVHTQSGMVKGKFNYMAPEQLSGEPIDARTDLFAAGLVLYELVTGRQGYEGEGQSIITRVLDARVRPAHELRADIPPPLAAILQRALQKDPAQRYPNAAAMEAELEQFMVSQGAPVTSRTVAAFLASVDVPGADPLAAEDGPATAHGSEPTSLKPASSPKRKAVARPKPAPKPAPEPEPAEDDAEDEVEHQADLASATLLTLPTEGLGDAPADPQVNQETVLAPAAKRPAPAPQRGSAPPPRRPAPAPAPAKRASTETAKVPASDAEPTLDESFDETVNKAIHKRSKAPFIVAAGALALAVVGAIAFLSKPDPAPAEDKPLVPPKPHVAAAPAGPDAAAPLAAVVDEPRPPAAEAGPDAAVVVAMVTPQPKQPEPKVEPKQPEPKQPEPKQPKQPEPAKPVVVAKGPDKPAGKDTKPPPTPAPAAEPGLLSILAQPWVYVRIDGQDAGQTPLVKKSLPAGTHRLALVNPDMGLKKELAVEIQAGQEHKEVVKFGKAKLTFVAVPWAEVRIDGKLLGQTPMPPQEVFEGVRSLSASNPDTGKKINREIAVEAGKDQTVKLDLR